MPARDNTPLLAAEHAVARSLAETARPDAAYRRVLAGIGETLRWQLGAAWEINADGEALHCVETWVAPSIHDHDFEAVTRSRRFARGEGLPGRVWLTGEPAWIVDVARDSNFPRASAAVTAGLHAAFCFPIRSPNGVLGAIEFFTAELRAPDPSLLSTMANVGGQIGQFVERRKAEAAVHRSEERKRAMLEAALDSVITMDHRGCVVEFNPSAERTFGYDAEEVIGREMAELIIPPRLRDRHRRGLERFLEDEKGAMLDRRIEIDGMRSDGTEFPVELTITRINLPGLPKFTGYIRDITDLKRVEAELRASRVRLVEAGDAERRRLERDLHDGAQQRLVGVALSLRLGRSKVETDPTAAIELLDEAMDDLAGATTELRELARGIHPAVLTEGGIEAALESLVGRAALPVKLACAQTRRLAPRVEAAAYFVVAEALTNVTRYAAATRAEVDVTHRNGSLVVEVSDDGKGGAEPQDGTGLRGLSDRLAAIDGVLEVVSPPGQGTLLRAQIPCA